MNYQDLPVYQQKERILETLRENQVIVVQSPTGSGKTTQIPVILHEAGYDEKGIHLKTAWNLLSGACRL